MFKRSKKANEERDDEAVDNQIMKGKPIYDRPKILLVDTEKSVADTLQTAGYNISVATFGKLYKVEKKDAYVPVIPQGSLPLHYQENEIVIIDLEVKTVMENPKGEKVTTPGESDWWVSSSMGVVDPRPRYALSVRDNFDRILKTGGVFIIFAAERFQQRISLAYVARGYGLQTNSTFDSDNWDFLNILGDIQIIEDVGKEIVIEQTELYYFLEAHLKQMHYKCTLKPWGQQIEKGWVSLAKNKYGDSVGALIVPGDLEEGASQLIFIFPQVQDKARFLKSFLSEVLPEFVPLLFPYFEGAKWVHRPEYELPKVRQLQHQIEEVRKTADREIANLTDAISEERNANYYLYKLLTASDAELVKAVEVALKSLGFNSIVNVDEEVANAGGSGSKREDLRIHDVSPTVLVEVKGIANLPREAAALQVHKYVAPRMREWDRTDVRGLSIINHQRNLPALDRENRTPFQEDVITNALELGFGLMTTWDLFRLVRSFLKNGWSHDQVRGIFYRNGRIEPIPTHYRLIGVVERVWSKVGAVGIRVQQDEICLGDRIAFEMPVEFEEQNVDSLQMDNQDVNRVGIGQLAGILTALIGHGLRQGMRVYQLTGRT